jgi:multiple sugar transport system permease protein
MKISYYAQKRITEVVINIVMLAFLALTLLPIVWMVYSSLKDSTDIAIGKVGLRRAAADILSINSDKDALLVLSADGGISYYRKSDLSLLQRHSYKTAATSFLLDDKYIWIASGTRGLLRVDRKNIKESRRFDFPVKDVDKNKIAATYIKREKEMLLVALEYKRFDSVMQFDVKNARFERLIKGGKGHYFPEAAAVKAKEIAGIENEILCEFKNYYGTRGGLIYKIEPTTHKILAQAKLPAGQLLVHFDNYSDMWKNVNFGLYLKNSIIICGLTMFFAMILATFAAYALSRFRFPGSDFFSNAILATQMIPMLMYLIPIYIMFVKFTLMTGIPVKGTYPGIVLIYSAWFLPFSIWILRGFFAAIPVELEEAALIDGCNRLQVFWYVALRLALPGIVATGIYIFLQAWDELMFAWVLTNADTMTIPVGIRLFVGNYQNRFDLMMAAATVATLPVVVLFFLLQRHIVRGLTAGAVKG